MEAALWDGRGDGKGAKDWWIGGSEVVNSMRCLPVYIDDRVYGQQISVGRHSMRDEDAMLQPHLGSRPG